MSFFYVLKEPKWLQKSIFRDLFWVIFFETKKNHTNYYVFICIFITLKVVFVILIVIL